LAAGYSRVLEVSASLTLSRLVLLNITVGAVAVAALPVAPRWLLVALAVVAVESTRAMLLRLTAVQTQAAAAVGATMVLTLLEQMVVAAL
jgi:hypothetical protein